MNASLPSPTLIIALGFALGAIFGFVAITYQSFALLGLSSSSRTKLARRSETFVAPAGLPVWTISRNR